MCAYESVVYVCVLFFIDEKHKQTENKSIGDDCYV